MSDDALRAAERALRADPFSVEARVTYARAWERAGMPLPRDPRDDPRAGDIVDGRLVVASSVDGRVAWVKANDRHRLWPVRIEGHDLRTPTIRVPDGWQTWRTGGRWNWTTRTSWRRWARARFPVDDMMCVRRVRWAEPYDWGEWHLAPQHHTGPAPCACRRCLEASRARLATPSALMG